MFSQEFVNPAGVDKSTWISTFSARELAEVQGAGPHYRDLLDMVLMLILLLILILKLIPILIYN